MILSGEKKTIFDGYSCATANGFVYNASGAQTATSGWKNIRANNVVVQYAVATLTASDIVYRIEGRFDSDSRSASVYCETMTATSTIDKLITITGRFDWLRAGAKIINTVATPNNLYVSLYTSETN